MEFSRGRWWRKGTIFFSLIYYKGKGVPQNYKKALKWYTLSAEQGNKVAQYNLGVMYSFGLGVIPDYKTALKWYNLSSEQRYALAQYNLGKLYYLVMALKRIWLMPICGST